jgi:DNA repair exonuclease SbcCD ATPase subunit
MDWLSREVFGQLYSLELKQLAKLDERARTDIDDLLLPRTSALPLRSPSEIRGELRSACTGLWRADNRGSSSAKRLRERLKKARDHLGEEQRRDRELRDARSERAELKTELQALRASKRELERERADASFLGDLFALNRHRRVLGPEIDLSELEDRRLLRPAELEADIEAHEARLREPQARLARAEVSIADAAAQVLELSTEIELALETRAHWDADRERLAEQKQEASKARERARDELRDALGGEPGDAELAAAAAVPIEALASAAAEWSDARDREFDGASLARNRARIWEAIAGCTGLAMIGYGWFAQLDARLIFPGALLLLAALCVGWFARSRSRRESLAAPRELDALLGELAVPQALSASPAALQRLVGLLVGIQRSLANASDRERGSAALEGQIGERESGWKELCERAGVDADGDGDLHIARLRTALESARAERDEVERDGRQRDDAQRLIDFEQPALDAKLEHRDKLRAALRAAEPESSDFDVAFERVEERSAEADFLRRRESELRRDPRFSAFENDLRVIAEDPPEDAPWLPGVCAARQQKLDELDEQLSEKQLRLGQLTALLSENTAGALSDAADAAREIRDEIESTERERDRLALLESILARAEREYREIHQPDVLRRASSYLERITDGRYHRIDLLDDHKGLLGVTPDGRSEPIEVGDPISQGTLDQIFLCLRLGMLDHLDEGRERLPLILDDALLRMDDQRRSAVYAVLGSMAPTRQVWILTCHRALADEVESNLKASRIDL